MKRWRIIQWFTGDIACHQIRLIHACPWLELVGAVVFHPEKAGRDAGEIAGIGPIGVIATADVEQALALEADCVLYNPPLERYDEIVRILASGKNVISIMAGWNPRRHPLYPQILRACEQGRASLYGTGLNPGLSYELALLASSCCTEVDSIHIRTCEPQDSLSEVFLTAFGFGRTREELAEGEQPVLQVFRNLLDITDLLCDTLTLPRDGHAYEVDFEPARAEYRGKITVRKGTMAGLLVRASSTHGGRKIASIELRFILGAAYVSEAFLAGRPRQGWIEVDVRGTPGSRITHELYMEQDVIGTWSTGTRAIHAIPFVCEAPPGILSAADLPLSRMLPLRGESPR